MITLILGQNSIGKSYIIERIKHDSNEIVASNKMDIHDLYSRGYNEERLDILTNNKYIDKIDCTNLKISINSIYDFSNTFEKLIFIICKQSDILLLDDVELELTKLETSILVYILYELADTFKDIYVVLHDNIFMYLMNHPNARTCTVQTVDEKIELVEIDEDKAYELID